MQSRNYSFFHISYSNSTLNTWKYGILLFSLFPLIYNPEKQLSMPSNISFFRFKLPRAERFGLTNRYWICRWWPHYGHHTPKKKMNFFENPYIDVVEVLITNNIVILVVLTQWFHHFSKFTDHSSQSDLALGSWRRCHDYDKHFARNSILIRKLQQSLIPHHSQGTSLERTSTTDATCEVYYTSDQHLQQLYANFQRNLNENKIWEKIDELNKVGIFMQKNMIFVIITIDYLWIRSFREI